MRHIFIFKIVLIFLVLNQTTFAGDAKHDIAALMAQRDNVIAIPTITRSLPINRTINSSWNALAEQYAIVLFISSTCPHCHRFAPIVKQFSEDTGMLVYVYSIDGNGLPEYPSPLLATQDVKRKFYQTMPVVVPGVFMVNVNTLAEVFVRVGEESKADFYSEMAQHKKTIMGGNL